MHCSGSLFFKVPLQRASDISAGRKSREQIQPCCSVLRAQEYVRRRPCVFLNETGEKCRMSLHFRILQCFLKTRERESIACFLVWHLLHKWHLFHRQETQTQKLSSLAWRKFRYLGGGCFPSLPFISNPCKMWKQFLKSRSIEKTGCRPDLALRL